MYNVLYFFSTLMTIPRDFFLLLNTPRTHFMTGVHELFFSFFVLHHCIKRVSFCSGIK